MKTKLIAVVLAAASASLAAPAFASGYGPAPFYNPEVGAPSSQRGPSAQTLAADENNAAAVNRSAMGGVESTSSESGAARVQANQADGTYQGR